jgi:TFIIF-interacting CTD phosphatase-like protein
MKTLLFDIDYTLFDGDTPRPYIKEFLEYVHKKYSIRFYTAGNRQRVTSALRVLVQMGLENEIIWQLDRKRLTRENCNTIEIESGATIKSLARAAEVLKVPIEDLILLDDNPKYDNPHKDQIIQAEGFMADMTEDDYLMRIINQGIL